MAFLVIALDDFLVAATDDFLVTADDTVPGGGTGFDNVAVGPLPATVARLGALDLSSARIGITVIWEELVSPPPSPDSAAIVVTGFAPTVVVSGTASSLTYMAPNGISITPSATSAALPFSSGGIGFVLDH